MKDCHFPEKIKNKGHKLEEYSNEKYKKWNNLVIKIARNHLIQCSYHKWYSKLRSKSFKYYIQFNIVLLVIRMSFLCIRMSLVCHLSVTYMYSFVVRMSLVCIRMLPVCHLYVTRKYQYVIRISLVCGFTMNPLALWEWNTLSKTHS